MILCALPKGCHLSSRISQDILSRKSLLLLGFAHRFALPYILVSLRPGTHDASAIAVEPVQEMARTHGPEMVQKRFCFRQDAWVLATYTTGRQGRDPI